MTTVHVDSNICLNRTDPTSRAGFLRLMLNEHLGTVNDMAMRLQGSNQDAKYLAAVRTLAAVSMALDSLDME